MRFSAVATLCAAPLALAGTLQADLVERGAVELETGISISNGKGGNSKSSGSSVDEIIVIWVNEGGGAATSTVTNTVTVTDASGTSAAKATHSVTVGGTAGLVYTPDTIEAAVGDMVIFTFESANHTVTQSAFNTPCEKLAGGVDSGFIPNINNSVSPPPQMAMQVTVATPIWFYCKQKGHCGKGMTFSINPTANKTQAMFQQMAIAQNGTGSASAITGGSTSSVAAPPPAVTSSAASSSSGSMSSGSSSGSMVSGSGTLNGAGACECSCLCGTAAFPNAAVQGVGAFGGMSGAMPMAALES
ncbi:hypothetical protein M430DRAFT_130471 [Amorphotheca resinae ATCC 22711]|uniref:Phytocyanin domain-containing protein n=1 Tax=Amorphotheca resinae ATCC 22711 TaxID=857342 RepID=A0A2T3BCY7_AMORE|nr:hypothetical protein M430DRAFT_130471 [Amorphotheca resinae ATCC 22711]PSS27198.1 hypothetical protein M430DRAFT_130471 [Amorphotheca resinae ATCC 22711]